MPKPTPTYASLFMEGMAHARQGEHASALAKFKSAAKAASNDKESADAWYQCGKCCEALGRDTEAKSAYAKAGA